MDAVDLNLSGMEFTRLANSFYNAQNLPSDLNRINLDVNLFNYILTNANQVKDKKKVAFCCICVNPLYWQYAKPLLDSARTFFLPGHQTDFFLWSDIPEGENTEAFKLAEQQTIERTLLVNNPGLHPQITAEIQASFKNLQENRKNLGATVFPIEPIEWPMPTLMRYHTMLQQEEKLKEYDYIFYCDVDMLFVNVVGDEILGDRLTAVGQPMYFIRKEWWPPYEPNDKSSAYIKRPSKLINDNGKPRMMPLYVAGGMQGGKSDEWIKAMKIMKKNIDSDLNNNYVSIWNDEGHWNKYLLDLNPSDKDIILTPSYTFPDSLQKEYFEPMWGCSYQPKLITLTKKFSFTPGGGEAVQKMVAETKVLQK